MSITTDDTLSVVKRAGECVRCKHYCPVRGVCPNCRPHKCQNPQRNVARP